NASGVAGMLEVAEAFAGGTNRPRRSLLFVAFAGEEWGLLGSHYLVEHLPVPTGDIVAMINFDMIGRLRPASGVEIEGTTTASAWPDLLARANREGLKLLMPQTTIRDSDHASFASAGWPVLFLFTGFHPDYHCYTDRADRINAQGLAQVASLSYRVLRELCDS